MSIAVAAVIRTPVCLRLLQAVLGLCALLAAWPLSGAWHVAALSGHGPGFGQLRLAVYLEHGGAPSSAGPLVPPVLRLLPGSTLWPSLLVLCLADVAGRRTQVLAQRGSACTAFRPLAVACRAIAARSGEE